MAHSTPVAQTDDEVDISHYIGLMDCRKEQFHTFAIAMRKNDLPKLGLDVMFCIAEHIAKAPREKFPTLFSPFVKTGRMPRLLASPFELNWKLGNVEKLCDVTWIKKYDATFIAEAVHERNERIINILLENRANGGDTHNVLRFDLVEQIHKYGRDFVLGYCDVRSEVYWRDISCMRRDDMLSKYSIGKSEAYVAGVAQGMIDGAADASICNNLRTKSFGFINVHGAILVAGLT